ncbi:MAG: type IV pilin [Asgard group archaeon]|nr:type IV pilin [Asgard group archaeon]
MSKIFNKIFPKKSDNKRGVSPVIATILLIALTVSAAAIVYFVIVPLLQGRSELVQMSTLDLTDTDEDNKFDTITTDLLNMGSDLATLDSTVSVIIYNGAPVTHNWQITSDLEYAQQIQKEITIHTNVNESQIDSLTSFEVIITYDGGKTLSLGRQFSNYISDGGGGEDPIIEDGYIPMDLYLRTALQDPPRTRDSFPTSSGYSPLLWFIVGIFESGERRLGSNANDYIASNGFGAAEDYHPYIGTTDYYTQDISAHTGYTALPYNDTGDYPGCITFCGNDFDNGDNLNWPHRGIIYLFTYIYNPTGSTMDIDVSVQVDDIYTLWVNGVAEDFGSDSRVWHDPVTITMNPGYNILTLRTIDTGGNWDAQILLWDTGAVDPITELLNVWPVEPPTSSYW